MVGLIWRSFSLDGELFKKLYICFVRPHLEYAQTIWQPHLVRQKRMIENVQIRATQLVDSFHDLTYKNLGLPTLTHRRKINTKSIPISKFMTKASSHQTSNGSKDQVENTTFNL